MYHKQVIYVNSIHQTLIIDFIEIFHCDFITQLHLPTSFINNIMYLLPTIADVSRAYQWEEKARKRHFHEKNYRKIQHRQDC